MYISYGGNTVGNIYQILEPGNTAARLCVGINASSTGTNH